MVVLPGGKVGFLELKAPGKKLRKEQYYRIQQLWDLCCWADAADSQKDVDRFLHVLSAGIPVPTRVRWMAGTEGEQ